MSRPAIPIKLKRKILVESGHRCAIPTCRSTQIEIAHIIPWVDVLVHEYKNLIALCPNCHTRYDKGEIDRDSIYIYKENLKFFMDKFSKFELDILFYLYNLDLNRGIPFVPFNFLFIKSLLDNNYVKLHDTGMVASFGDGINSAPNILLITEIGRKFMDDFIKSDIGYTLIK